MILIVTQDVLGRVIHLVKLSKIAMEAACLTNAFQPNLCSNSTSLLLTHFPSSLGRLFKNGLVVKRLELG